MALPGEDPTRVEWIDLGAGKDGREMEVKMQRQRPSQPADQDTVEGGDGARSRHSAQQSLGDRGRPQRDKEVLTQRRRDVRRPKRNTNVHFRCLRGSKRLRLLSRCDLSALCDCALLVRPIKISMNVRMRRSRCCRCATRRSLAVARAGPCATVLRRPVGPIEPTGPRRARAGRCVLRCGSLP